MLLTAMLDGDRVDATTYTPEAWAELQESEDRKHMILPLCGIRAVPRKRGRFTRYFAHYSKKDCKAAHGGESPQHLAMKEALKRCIDNVPGWHAIVEHPHESREWTIDVLAESDDLTKGVAFEVQLSSQTPDAYLRRSQRYFDSNLFPVWLVPRQLEPHPTKVPVVVTGFGKTSEVPDDVSELLSLPAGQDFLRADDRLGAFVEALLLHGHSWKHGTPEHQAAQQKAAAAQAAAEAETERKRLEALEQSIAEMNERSASPESAFGGHAVHAYTDTFVWGSLTCCWNCEEPMLEDQVEVQRAVDAWIAAVKPDIPKAAIKLRRTKASGRLYSAFVCPRCDSAMGQFFISRIRSEKWSIISGHELETPQPTPVPQPHAAAAPSTSGRCRIHAIPKQWCDWCEKRAAPRLGNRFFTLQ